MEMTWKTTKDIRHGEKNYAYGSLRGKMFTELEKDYVMWTAQIHRASRHAYVSDDEATLISRAHGNAKTVETAMEHAERVLDLLAELSEKAEG